MLLFYAVQRKVQEENEVNNLISDLLPADSSTSLDNEQNRVMSNFGVNIKSFVKLPACASSTIDRSNNFLRHKTHRDEIKTESINNCDNDLVFIIEKKEVRKNQSKNKHARVII